MSYLRGSCLGTSWGRRLSEPQSGKSGDGTTVVTDVMSCDEVVVVLVVLSSFMDDH